MNPASEDNIYDSSCVNIGMWMEESLQHPFGFYNFGHEITCLFLLLFIFPNYPFAFNLTPPWVEVVLMQYTFAVVFWIVVPMKFPEI